MSAVATEEGKTFWVPLESNPEVLTKFAQKIGMPSLWQFHDCFGLDDELLPMTPQPCVAVLLLFPYDKLKGMKHDQHAKIESEGQTLSPQLYYMRQIVGNACGTVAVMHALANTADKLCLDSECSLMKFVTSTITMDFQQRGEALVKAKIIEEAHHSIATEGQTDAPSADDNVEYHFICFVQVDGALYELDGAKKYPINHGVSSEETFLSDASKVIKTNFFEKADGDMHFSVITLGPAQDEDDM